MSFQFVQMAMCQVRGPQLEKWCIQNVCYNHYEIRKCIERVLERNGDE
ncbi:hypothetical protein CLV84_0923 [Neolewinella xylanilytica]|uniref:Uncharacterized protein n=1 Tax=Neolewinella xylanilytica TaxID=1514080 RepID=A0A2S6I8Z5_9BACT|nr:hypothetical protein CLV84_0923 [Neolewinella xylanilytica]